MHIFFGLTGIVCSFLILIYRVPIKRFIGPIEWAERRLGPGGTYTALLLVAIVMFFVSIMIMTNTLDILLGPLAMFFRK